MNDPMDYVDPLGLSCSGNAGENDTPCSPYNSGDGSGLQDPGEADFGDPLALAEAQYVANLPWYAVMNGEVYLIGPYVLAPNGSCDPTNPDSNAGTFYQLSLLKM